MSGRAKTSRPGGGPSGEVECRCPGPCDVPGHGAEAEELQRLRETVTCYEDIIRSLPVGFIFIDENDRVAMVNPLGEEIRCVGDRLGAPVAECHPEGTHSMLEKVMRRFRETPQEKQHPIVLERMHRYEVTYSRVSRSDGGYRGVLWMASDISRRKRLERELLHAERLAGLGRMAAKVAHDIKNPLNAIQGAAHFLQQGEAESDETVELTALIKDQVARISRLITHVSELTRPFELKLEPQDLRSVVREQLRACGLSYAGNSWTLEVEDDVVEEVPCDRALVERLVCNAAENAWLAMDEVGPLEVRIRQANVEDGGWIFIEFQDHGPGFPREILEDLFQPFLTTRPDGTGLGLTIMREICLLHGGDLEIENNDTGALVTARLSAR